MNQAEAEIGNEYSTITQRNSNPRKVKSPINNATFYPSLLYIQFYSNKQAHFHHSILNRPFSAENQTTNLCHKKKFRYCPQTTICPSKIENQ